MVSVTKSKAGGSGGRSSASVKNPFKDDKEPGCAHYGVMLAVTVLVMAGFLLFTDQGKSDLGDFHDKHIRQHLQRLKKKHHSHHTNSNNNKEEEHMEYKHQNHHHHKDHGQEKPPQHVEGERHNHKHHKQEDFPPVSLTEFPQWLHRYAHETLDWNLVAGQYPLLKEADEAQPQPPQRQLDSVKLQQSLELGCQNLVHNQLPAGNFEYLYDFVQRSSVKGEDSQVRQAGALWGVALCFQQMPHKVQWQQAVEKGIDFFVFDHGRMLPPQTEEHEFDQGHSHHFHSSFHNERLIIQYPGEHVSETGTNALVGLALIEYLRTMKDHAKVVTPVDQDRLDVLYNKLESLIALLQSLQLHHHAHENNKSAKLVQVDDDEEESQHFASAYDLQKQKPDTHASPYFDGEALLCLVKAAKYIFVTEQQDEKHEQQDNNSSHSHHEEMVAWIQETAPALFRAYSVHAWREYGKLDADLTKGFYQWSSMAAAEYYTESHWDQDRELYRDYLLTMAHWIIHTHRILHRTRNTGYAFEGLLSTYQLVRQDDQDDASHKDDKTTTMSTIRRVLEYVIDEGLHNLSTWQVGGPLAYKNAFLQLHQSSTETDLKAVGAVMNAKADAALRIDTTQHQMHAVIMAMNSGIYPTTAVTARR
ncbi:hypothetical protein ACA910_020032 [Epithemia clementina (nom. ined.)]